MLLELGLVDVPSAAHESFPDLTLELLDRLVVAIIKLFDDLKRPPAVEHVAADDVVAEPGGFLTMAGAMEGLRGVAEEEVCSTHHLVEVVEAAPESLNPLQRFTY